MFNEYIIAFGLSVVQADTKKCQKRITFKTSLLMQKWLYEYRLRSDPTGPPFRTPEPYFYSADLLALPQPNRALGMHTSWPKNAKTTLFVVLIHYTYMFCITWWDT
jgi:hypothetical protein